MIKISECQNAPDHSVDNNGKVTAVANTAANTPVIITASIGGQTATCQVTVTGVMQTFHISLGTLSNVTIEDGHGNAITNGQAVLENSSLTVKLVPAANYEITTASVTMDDVAQTLTDNQDGSKSVALTVSGDITVSASATYVEKDYADDKISLNGYVVKASSGSFEPLNNFNVYIIPLDFGKYYHMTGYDWADRGGTSTFYNIALVKSDGNGGYANIVSGTDVTAPADMKSCQMKWDSGNVCILTRTGDFYSRDNFFINVPPKSPAFASGIDHVYLAVNFSSNQTLEFPDLSVKEFRPQTPTKIEYVASVLNYLQVYAYVTDERIIPLEFGASYEYRGYTWQSQGGNYSNAYGMTLVALVDGVFRSITKNDVLNSDVDEFFTEGTYATRKNAPATGSFTTPADTNLPGVDKIYLAVVMLHGNDNVDLSGFTFNEVQ